ncbi:hypothetical protein THAOC_17893 [Thalassiosira oceanica]|uniref:Uncharacterized protein n=1 Tax=Thalassiosira oceanica TaxID=159749 RepID=K0STI3_THAOC|nr:hypothetical protein THAOC_17893 [Thalassiosira oceanica]|eukprot:EJK61592.1 hypothetical protein THAOC_17893 [Thalassiosira oceanica]
MRDSTWTVERDKTDPVLKSKLDLQTMSIARCHVVISRPTCDSAIEGQLVPRAAYKSAYKTRERDIADIVRDEHTAEWTSPLANVGDIAEFPRRAVRPDVTPKLDDKTRTQQHKSSGVGRLARPSFVASFGLGQSGKSDLRLVCQLQEATLLPRRSRRKCSRREPKDDALQRTTLTCGLGGLWPKEFASLRRMASKPGSVPGARQATATSRAAEPELDESSRGGAGGSALTWTESVLERRSQAHTESSRGRLSRAEMSRDLKGQERISCPGRSGIWEPRRVSRRQD